LPDLQYIVSVGEEDLWYDDRIYQFEDLAPRARVAAGISVFAGGRSGRGPLRDRVHVGNDGQAEGCVADAHEPAFDRAATADALEIGPDDVVFGVNTLFNVFGLGPGCARNGAAGATWFCRRARFLPRSLEVIEAGEGDGLSRRPDHLHPGPARADTLEP
jgi:hypothetical protein